VEKTVRPSRMLNLDVRRKTVKEEKRKEGCFRWGQGD